MEYFNKKEEVFSLHLTKEGLELLSKGKWKPAYYSFSDDSVVYDSNYSAYTESQNSAMGRIFDTPQMKYVPMSEEPPLIGTTSPFTKMSPALKVNVLNGEINSITSSKTSSIFPTKLYPEISMEDATYYVDESDDGVYSVRDSYLLIEVLEEGVEYTSENYDIQVRLANLTSGSVKTGGETEETDDNKPLYFEKKYNEIINNILIQDLSVTIKPMPETLQYIYDDELVAYYLDVAVDKEIENSILCQAKSRMIIDGTMHREPDIDDCPDKEPAMPTKEKDPYDIPPCPDDTKTGTFLDMKAMKATTIEAAVAVDMQKSKNTAKNFGKAKKFMNKIL